jgi:hypothetical protein
MDAAVALLRELAPLAREFGWPVFLVVLLPSVWRIANAHVRLIDTLRRCLPRAVRNQNATAATLKAVIAFLQEREKPAKPDLRTRATTPLADLLQQS